MSDPIQLTYSGSVQKNVVYPKGIKTGWQVYKTFADLAVDTDDKPVGIQDPVVTSSNYHDTEDAVPTIMNLSQGSRLHIRARMVTTAGTLTITVIGWGLQSATHVAAEAGTVLFEDEILTATAFRDGDGSAGAFLSNEIVIDVDGLIGAHIFATAFATSSNVFIDWALN